MNSKFKSGVTYGIIGTLFYGLVGVFVREAEVGLGPVTQSFARIFFAFVFISAYLLIKGGVSLKVSQPKLRWLAVVALAGVTIQAMAFTQAVSKTSIANAYFLLYSAPIFVVLFGYIFLRERVSKEVLGVVLLSMVGVALMFNPSHLYQHLSGNLFGFTTGLTFAIYLLLIKHKLKSVSPVAVTFWTLGFGALGLLIASLAFERNSVSSISANALGWTVLAGGAVFLGTIFLNLGLDLLAAWQSSIVSLLEAVGALFYGLIIFGEVPPLTTFLGAIVIAMAVLLLAHEQKQNKWIE